MLETGNLIQEPHVCGKDPITWAITAASQTCISRKLESGPGARNELQVLWSGMQVS